MFSNDKNIDTIGRLVEELTRYLNLQKEYYKLDLIVKVVTLLKVAAIVMAAILIFMFVVIFLSCAIAYALSSLVGPAWAFCILAAFYFIIFILFVAFRKSLIERPLVRFLASLFLEK